MSIEFQRNAAFTGILMPINAILDPVIYYFRSAEFRAFYQRLKRSWQGTKVNSSKPTPSWTIAWKYRVTRQIKPVEGKWPSTVVQLQKQKSGHALTIPNEL